MKAEKIIEERRIESTPKPDSTLKTNLIPPKTTRKRSNKDKVEKPVPNSKKKKSNDEWKWKAKDKLSRKNETSLFPEVLPDFREDNSPISIFETVSQFD